MWSIQLFGGLRLTQAHQQIDHFRTHHQAVLLSYLAYHLHQKHRREALIVHLWPDAATQVGRSRFRTELSLLRQQLEPMGTPEGGVLIATRTHLYLNPAAVQTDVEQFEAQLQAARHASDTATSIPLLQDALALYTGDLLPDFYEDWVQPERQRLAFHYHQALRTLALAYETSGEPQEALVYAQHAVQADPLSEESHCHLMRLYATLGHPSEVFHQYQEFERIWQREFDAPPPPAIQLLSERLREQASRVAVRRLLIPSQAAASLPLPSSLPPLSLPPLPRRTTRFFGRQTELERLLALLLPNEGGVQVFRYSGIQETSASDDAPSAIQNPKSKIQNPAHLNTLLTLTGPGGSGKTRLALETAHQLAQVYQHQVAFVPLANLRDANLIPATLLDALQISRSPQQPPLQNLLQALQSRPSAPLFLVLDNFEQLVEEGTGVVQTLLEQVPDLHLLLTSRHSLQLRAERLFPLAPLPTPQQHGTPERLMEFASVQLFVDRAQGLKPEFEVTPANADAIAQLCSRLEGLPLALELAASRTQVMPPQEMLAEWQAHWEFLASPHRDVEGRHQTLWTALDWSYRLLPEPLQRFFVQLSVFRGGWTVAAASAVCEVSSEWQVRQNLQDLCACSLVWGEEQEGEWRFRMLVTIREFAWEQLSSEEQHALQQRHCRYFVALAEEAEPILDKQQHSEQLLDQFAREHDNLLAVLDWGQQHDAEGGVRLCQALFHYWRLRNHSPEILQWIFALLESSPALTPHGRVEALWTAGWWARGRSDVVTEKALLEEALAITRANDLPRQRARVLKSLGILAHERGDYAQASLLLAESVALFDTLRDHERRVALRGQLGHAARYAGQWEQARAFYEEGVQIAQEVGDKFALTKALDGLGDLLLDQRDFVAARACYEEKLRLCREIGNQEYCVHTLNDLGNTAFDQADYGAARECYREGLLLAQEIGFLGLQTMCLHKLARCAFSEPDHAAMRDWCREGLLLVQSLQDVRSVARFLREVARLLHAQSQIQNPKSKIQNRTSLLLGAVRLMGVSAQIQEEIEILLTPSERAVFDPFLSELRAASGEEAFAVEYAEGKRMFWEQAVSHAFALMEMSTPSGVGQHSRA